MKILRTSMLAQIGLFEMILNQWLWHFNVFSINLFYCCYRNDDRWYNLI